MKRSTIWILAAAAASFAAMASFAAAVRRPAGANAGAHDQPTDVAALKAEVERLKGIVPDQAHAMKDVGDHYTNLWFAGKQRNWPLAEFYWSETRSHLHWAVRIIPVRKDPMGNDVRLEEILAPIESTRLEAVHKAIVEKDAAKFETAYTEMLDSCYACHLAAGKPFLKLKVPERPESSIIRFEPEP